MRVNTRRKENPGLKKQSFYRIVTSTNRSNIPFKTAKEFTRIVERGKEEE